MTNRIVTTVIGYLCILTGAYLITPGLHTYALWSITFSIRLIYGDLINGLNRQIF